VSRDYFFFKPPAEPSSTMAFGTFLFTPPILNLNWSSRLRYWIDGAGEPPTQTPSSRRKTEMQNALWEQDKQRRKDQTKQAQLYCIVSVYFKI
jgi:hypothetical protein